MIALPRKHTAVDTSPHRKRSTKNYIKRMKRKKCAWQISGTAGRQRQDRTGWGQVVSHLSST